MTFYQKLHELAIELAKETEYDFNEYSVESLKYSGELLSNYPWIYVDFKAKAPLDLSQINSMEAKIKGLCEQHKGASYLNTIVGTKDNLRFRLTYREDLD